MPKRDRDCWGAAEAEARMHAYAAPRNDELELAYTRHATQRMAERGIIASDIMYILSSGHIDDDGEEIVRIPNPHGLNEPANMSPLRPDPLTMNGAADRYELLLPRLTH